MPYITPDGEEDLWETNGIFLDFPDGENSVAYLVLITFRMRAQADKSLRNLFKCWRENPGELYIVPHGTEWLVEK